MEEENPIDFFTDLVRVKNGASPVSPLVQDALSSPDALSPSSVLNTLLNEHAELFEHTRAMRMLEDDLQSMLFSLRDAPTLVAYSQILRRIKFTCGQALLQIR